jgi:protein-arginine kinase activator protein McsA
MEDPGTGKKKKTATVSSHDEEGEGNDLKKMTVEELNTLLNEVLEQEDYIRAIAIRDELNARKKNR